MHRIKITPNTKSRFVHLTRCITRRETTARAQKRALVRISPFAKRLEILGDLPLS